MKKILAISLTLAAAALTFAFEPKAGAPAPLVKPDSLKIDTAAFHAKFDSLRKEFEAKAPAIKPDSAAFHHDLDSVKDSGRKLLGERKGKFDSLRAGKFDTAKAAEFKAKMDSLRQDWVAKREAEIAKIKDTAVQAKLRARVEKIEAKKAEVKAKIEAKKAELKAKKPEAPAAE